MAFLSLVFAADIACSSELTTFKPTYDSAIKSDSGRIRDGIRQLDDMIPRAEQVGGLTVLKGSLLCKLADLDLFFWNKLVDVNNGVALMKKGMDLVESDKRNLYDGTDILIVRLAMGITSGHIPSAFQSPQVCIKELEASIKTPEFSSVIPSTRAEAFALLSKKYLEKGQKQEADQYRQMAISIDRDTAKSILKM